MYVRYGDTSAWESVDGTEPRADGAPPVDDLLVDAAETVAPPAPGEPAGSRPVTPALPSVKLHGVRLHAITEPQAIDHILDELDAGNGGVVVTPNLDHLRRCQHDLSFNALVAEADVVVPDGMPLIWASRLQGTPLPSRVAGSDLISSLSTGAARRGRSVFLLGGAPGAADGAARVLAGNNPDLRVAGTCCPPMGFERDDVAVSALITQLVTADPDIVFVGLGSPKQELLVQRIRYVLPDAWWLGVGVSFSFLCGDVRRAPQWMRAVGLEWVHRLLQEPRRLFYRYVVVGVPFGTRLLVRAAVKGAPRFVGLGRTAPAPIETPNLRYFAPPGFPTAARRAAGANNLGTRRTSGVAGRRTGRRQLQQHAESAVPTTGSAAEPRSLHKLRAIVLLGGSVRSSELSEATGRSVLDLPLDAETTIFNNWLAQAQDLARHAGLASLPVRVMVNRNTPEPASALAAHYGTFRVERDLSEYRGTGGVLRDLAADFADDDLVLVANAAQVLLDPLAAIATALDRKRGDVCVVSHQDGTPSGVSLVRCETLRLISAAGYVDMKEQALPLIAQKYAVNVMHRRRPTGLPVRTLSDYVLAMRLYHRRKRGITVGPDPLGEDWKPTFAVIEPGATVDVRAHVHDSVVLKGSVVEAGAVVVRSIVCPSGIVRRDRSAVDQLICGE